MSMQWQLAEQDAEEPNGEFTYIPLRESLEDKVESEYTSVRRDPTSWVHLQLFGLIRKFGPLLRALSGT